MICGFVCHLQFRHGVELIELIDVDLFVTNEFRTIFALAQWLKL